MIALFLVSQVAKTRKITPERAKRAVYLQRQLAKPVEQFKPEKLCDLIDQADAMATTVFCPDCRFNRAWKIGTKQCNGSNGCNQWFCSGHIKGNCCQSCQELHSMKSRKRGRKS